MNPCKHSAVGGLSFLGRDAVWFGKYLLKSYVYWTVHHLDI